MWREARDLTVISFNAEETWDVHCPLLPKRSELGPQGNSDRGINKLAWGTRCFFWCKHSKELKKRDVRWKNSSTIYSFIHVSGKWNSPVAYILYYIPCHLCLHTLGHVTWQERSQHGVARQFLLAHLLLFIQLEDCLIPATSSSSARGFKFLHLPCSSTCTCIACYSAP